MEQRKKGTEEKDPAVSILQHTPGPWEITHKKIIERPIRIREHFAIAPIAGPTLAFLPEGRFDIQEANARLIAAAPEMAELLNDIGGVIFGWEWAIPYLHRIRTILARIEGGE